MRPSRQTEKTCVSQSSDTRHGQQHVSRLVNHSRTEKVGVQSNTVNQGQSDDPLEADEMQQLSSVSLSEEVVLQHRVEGSADSHGGCGDGVVSRLAHWVSRLFRHRGLLICCCSISGISVETVDVAVAIFS